MFYWSRNLWDVIKNVIKEEPQGDKTETDTHLQNTDKINKIKSSYFYDMLVIIIMIYIHLFLC